VRLRHDYAYGEHGNLPRIPGFAELFFTIALVDIQEATQADAAAGAPLALPSPEDVADAQGA
jgi:hypothetical protein